MTHGYVRDASEDDIQVLADNLRPADIAEIKAASGNTPGAAMLRGVQGGTSKVACLPSGTPAAIFGIVPVTPLVGGVWMVATNDFHLLHRQFLRECKAELGKLSADYRRSSTTPMPATRFTIGGSSGWASRSSKDTRRSATRVVRSSSSSR